MPAPPDAIAPYALQVAFARALLLPRPTVPAGIEPGRAPSPMRRFTVHRNNVRASLVAALAARYPVVRRLVGDAFFEAMALIFIADHPPASPVLAEYGAGIASFLEDFEPAADLPYLPDVARLEWARQRAYHAADTTPISIDRLAALPPERLDSVRLTLHPAAAAIVSSWPVLSIWTTNTEDAEVTPLGPEAGPESVLVTRPALRTLVNRLPPGADVLLAALAEGATLGEALLPASAAEPAFDVAATLALLFTAGAIAGLSEGHRT